MTQSPSVTRISNFARAFLVCTFFAVILSSCVKMPRRMIHSASPTAKSMMLERSPANASVINLNTASRVELEKLPGIGEGLAARIIEHRERYGDFRRVEHLLMVSGISERRFEELRSFVTVE